jgi:hypothetical protein
MSLRKLPFLTSASLAAWRAGVLKTMGPRTECGTGRVALSYQSTSVRRSRCGKDWLGRPLRCSVAKSGPEAQDFRAAGRRFRTSRLPSGKPGLRVSAGVARVARTERAKLECPLKSMDGTARLTKPTRIVTNCCTCDKLPAGFWPVTCSGGDP